MEDDLFVRTTKVDVFVTKVEESMHVNNVDLFLVLKGVNPVKVVAVGIVFFAIPSIPP